jgi:hypothetical protein
MMDRNIGMSKGRMMAKIERARRPIVVELFVIVTDVLAVGSDAFEKIIGNARASVHAMRNRLNPTTIDSEKVIIAGHLRMVIQSYKFMTRNPTRTAEKTRVNRARKGILRWKDFIMSKMHLYFSAQALARPKVRTRTKCFE